MKHINISVWASHRHWIISVRGKTETFNNIRCLWPEYIRCCSVRETTPKALEFKGRKSTTSCHLMCEAYEPGTSILLAYFWHSICILSTSLAFICQSQSAWHTPRKYSCRCLVSGKLERSISKRRMPQFTSSATSRVPNFLVTHLPQQQ